MKSLLVQVIAVYEGENVTYFTLEGVEIGRMKGGAIEEKQVETVETRKVGGVVTAKSPQQVADERDGAEQKLVDELIHGKD